MPDIIDQIEQLWGKTPYKEYTHHIPLGQGFSIDVPESDMKKIAPFLTTFLNTRESLGFDKALQNLIAACKQTQQCP